MELVVNANVLFSFFKFNSPVRNLIIKSCMYKLKLYTPSFCIEELENNKDRILYISKSDSFNFVLSLSAINSFISTLSKSEYSNFLSRAEKLLKGHLKDVPYFALALKLDCPLWSEERRLKNQDVIRVFNTSDLLKELELSK